MALLDSIIGRARAGHTPLHTVGGLYMRCPRVLIAALVLTRTKLRNSDDVEQDALNLSLI